MAEAEPRPWLPEELLERDAVPSEVRTAAILAFGFLLVACASAPPPSPCNPTNARILGNWAQPEVHYVDEEGNASPANWRAELWLPTGGDAELCNFSCASDVLAAIIPHPPATLVRLSRLNPERDARRLALEGATLSVSGNAGVHQQGELHTDRWRAHEENAGYESYAFAFPPTNPPTWDHLEVLVRVEGSTERLRVRFVRGENEGWP